MTNEIIITTNTLFKSVIYSKKSNSWYFTFDNEITVHVETIWRLLENKKIKWVSLDHGQIFGLSKSINLEKKLGEELKGKHLLEIKVKQDTADLLLTLTENLQIEIFRESLITRF